jgi:pyruvate-formate lyase-activating enzyme
MPSVEKTFQEREFSLLLSSKMLKCKKKGKGGETLFGKQILGMLHYRTDLGDGMRSAIYFNTCYGTCGSSCVPHRFLREHPFGEDTLEKKFYTAEELIEYLREEKVLCNTKKLGISFLGREPLADPDFCYDLAMGVKDLEMDLCIETCGNISQWIYDKFYGVADLFLFNYFTPVPGRFHPFDGYSHQRAWENLCYLDHKNFPYRLRIFVLEGINADSASPLMLIARSLKNVKSVILDFSNSGLNEEEIAAFRSVFLKNGVVLY